MRNTASPSIGVTTLLEASTMLGRCRTEAQIMGCVSHTLGTLGGVLDYDVVWNADGSERRMRSGAEKLPAPSRSTRLLLADGQVAVEGNVSYVPLVARGLLQGWIAIRGDEPVEPWLASFAGHVAAALISIDVAVVTRSPDRERALIDAIAEVGASTLDLQLLLQRIGAMVGDMIDARGFFVALIDHETRQFSFAYMRLSGDVASSEVRWSSEQGLTGIVLRTGEPLVAEDYLEECERRGISPQGAPGIPYAKAWMGVPLRHQDRILGVMIVTHDTEGVRFEASDVRLLSTVAAQTAAAVANAQLYARVAQQRSQLELINKIGRTIASTLDPQTVPMLLVDELTEVLLVDEAIVYTYEPSSGMLEVRYARSQRERIGTRVLPGRSAYEALQRNTVVITSEHDGTLSGSRGDVPEARSVLYAALHGRQLTGLIELRSARAGQFRTDDVAFVQAVAEQATIALENALQYGQTDEALRVQLHNLEEQNQQLAKVVTIGNSLRSSFSVQQVAMLIAEAIHSLSRASHVVLGLVDNEQRQVSLVARRGLRHDSARIGAEQIVSLDTLADWLSLGDPIGTSTVQVGRYAQPLGYENALLIAMKDSLGALIGVIVIERDERAEVLTPGLIQSLEIVASQAGIALTNAALYGELQQTIDRLTALNALTLSVNTNQLSDLEILTMVIAGAVGTTGGQAGGARLALPDQPELSYHTTPERELDPAWLQQIVPDESDYVELTDANLLPATLGENIQRLLVAPLRGANLTVGTLWIAYTQPSSTKAERETAVLYAKMAGAVLESQYLAGAVRGARDRMASILASTREGMLLVGRDRRITVTNRAFADLLGIAQMQLHERTIDEAAADEALRVLPDDVRQQISVALGAAGESVPEIAEGQISLAGPPERNLTWHVLPVHSTNGEASGALLVLRDVTADRQMERLRQDLANMIVHDLRSPLTNMLVSVDMLLKPKTGPLNERQHRILSIASSSCHQMLDLVNALLDIRRLEKRSVKLQRRPSLLPAIADEVLEMLERIAEERVVRVAVDLNGLPIVEVDPEMIRRVLQNLVDNALKFSPPDSTVQISGVVDEGPELPEGHAPGRWVVVSVHDEGQGVPTEYQQVIFELFVQAPDGHGQGTGVGLSFCKLAVEAHGGKIWVESVPGRGSTFRFTLPVAA